MTLTPTHAALVQRAARWLAGTARCPVVLTEFSTGHCPESPDAIGWGSGGRSVLVECKASRADFRADRKKAHRSLRGPGERRYFMAAPGVIPHAELPAGWGLLEWNVEADRVRKVVEAEGWTVDNQDLRAMCLDFERALLVAAVRRVQLGGDAAVGVMRQLGGMA